MFGNRGNHLKTETSSAWSVTLRPWKTGWSCRKHWCHKDATWVMLLCWNRSLIKDSLQLNKEHKLKIQFWIWGRSINPPVTRRGVLDLGSSTLGSTRYFGLDLGDRRFVIRSRPNWIAGEIGVGWKIRVMWSRKQGFQDGSDGTCETPIFRPLLHRVLFCCSTARCCAALRRRYCLTFYTGRCLWAAAAWLPTVLTALLHSGGSGAVNRLMKPICRASPNCRPPVWLDACWNQLDPINGAARQRNVCAVLPQNSALCKRALIHKIIILA